MLHVNRTPPSRSKVKGQDHQAALLTAAITREADAAVTVRTYWAWAPTGRGEGRRHIVSHAHSLLLLLYTLPQQDPNDLCQLVRHQNQ